MKNLLYFLGVFCILYFSTHALTYAQKQPKFTLKGYLKDAENGEGLLGATVYVKELRTGTATNLYGFYSLSLEAGTYTISYSYIGYTPIQKTVNLTTDQTLTVELQAEGTELEGVEVTAEAEDEALQTVEMSVVKLEMAAIKKIPQFLGETDIIRSIQLLPGVTTVGEGATGFNVRGGNIDQNLILLDEAPIYSSSHLFGFFSVFNGDAVKDVKLYKGGIPAIYGGRLSSVLDIRQKEGNMKKFSGSGGIGAVSSRLTLEAPIIKDKSSFMISGRRSYADLFLIFSRNEAMRKNKAYFYDVNAKFNYQFSDKDRLFISGYFGNDVFGFGQNFAAKWGNRSGTIRWNHLFSDRVFANFTGIYSNYEYKLGVPSGANAFDWTSHIYTMNLRSDFTFFANPKNTLDFGLSALRYRFEPGLVTSDNFPNLEIDKKFANEFGIYISNEQTIGDNLTLKYGVRYSLYQHMGKATVYEYTDGEPMTTKSITDTLFYDQNKVIQSYGGFEPRFSLNWRLSPKNSVKLSYNRTRQYIHLISNTTAATPLDIWTSSDKHIKPAIADQVAMGYFQNFKNNQYELSAEVYYKELQDLVDYKDGAQLLFNETLEADLLSGKGRAYGLEIMLKKQKGRFTGWLSYTLSRSEIRVDSDLPEDRINNGDWYPSNYDKLHDLSAVLSYDINEKWSISANYAYMTGRPITYPDAKYEYEGITVGNYGNRNGARTPTYHRLDFSANYEKIKPNRKWQSSWNFSIYNVYARKNPYSIYFRQNEDNYRQTEAVQLSILGTILPSATYNFKF